MDIRLPRNASMFEELIEPLDPEHKINLHFEKNIQSNLHSQEQLGKDCPYHKNQNKFNNTFELPYIKIMYPFKIKTPKGYACLFMPPLNVEKKDYEILSGIVDTDTFPMYVNFPFKMTGKSKRVILKKGEVFAQCIPYKKESWSLKVSENKESKRVQKLKKIFFFSYIIDNYKKIVWNKQRWN
jgi:ribosomal protein L25 (general stress protein Ctc)